MDAYDVHQAGLSVSLLEASDRIGGRSRTHKLQSGPGIVELGATWINRYMQPAVYELTKRFHLETLQQYTEGDSLLEVDEGDIIRSQSAFPDDPAILHAFEMFQNAVDGHNILNFDFAADEDVTFDNWLLQKGVGQNPKVMALFALLTNAWVGQEPRELGAHYIINYVKSALGFDSIVGSDDQGAQSLKIKEGTSSNARALASALPRGCVQTNAVVDTISQHGSHALLRTSSGAEYRAQRVILAIPTNTYSYIRFFPPLLAPKRSLISSTEPGVQSKFLATYRHPWWREAGLVRQFASFRGPICFTFDNSDASLAQFSLTIFVCGDRGRELARHDALRRKHMVFEPLARIVGPELAEQARNPIEVNYVEWSKEEFLYGVPTSCVPPGVLRENGDQFREPFKLVHFAGGETALEWKGYLEGAILAGKRAAQEVVHELRPGKDGSS